MKQIWLIGMLILIAMLAYGCSNESKRLADMAERTARSQNIVNANVTRTTEKFVELNKELQKERAALQDERLSLNEQFEKLDQDRGKFNRRRRSDLVWSESFRLLAVVIAAVMPLFLCAYLIWATSKRSIEQEEINSILLRELASPRPRLIVAPNLPEIEDQSDQDETQSNTQTN